MKKLLLLLLRLPAAAAPTAAPPADTVLLRQFMQAVTDGHTPDSTLIARFMCPDLLLRHGDPRVDRGRAGLTYLFGELRKDWRSRPGQLRRGRFLPSAAVPHPDFHMLGDEQGAYVLVVDDKPLIYFLVENSQVASFLLLDQGGERYFLDFCH